MKSLMKTLSLRKKIVIFIYLPLGLIVGLSFLLMITHYQRGQIWEETLRTTAGLNETIKTILIHDMLKRTHDHIPVILKALEKQNRRRGSALHHAGHRGKGSRPGHPEHHPDPRGGLRLSISKAPTADR